MFKKVTAVVLALALLAGCSFGSKGEVEVKGRETLRVLYYDEGSFYQQYGTLYTATHTNVDVEFISMESLYNQNSDDPIDYEKAYYDLLEKEKPDIIFLDATRFQTMAEENKLANLDTYMNKSKLDQEGFIPGLLDYIKEMGNGSLYGLAPDYQTQVIFYNKDLFDKYNVPYPTNKMTWEDVFQRARQFPTDGEKKERVYGLKFGYMKDLYQLAMQVASTEQLQLANGTTKQLSINSDSWKKVFHMVTDAVEADVLFYEQDRYANLENGSDTMAMSMNDHYFSDPFVGGRLAMSLNDSYYLNELKRTNSWISEEDRLLKNWDIVTAPVSSQNQDVGSGISIYNIIAIPSDAANLDTAWGFLEYIAGDEYARVNSKGSYSGGLSVRTEYNKGDGSYNHEALFMLKPSTNTLYRNNTDLSEAFSMNFYSEASISLAKVLNKEAELDEVLDQLQLKGEQWIAEGKDANSNAESNEQTP